MKADMQKIVFRLPRLGGSEIDARVLVWNKAPGESFAADETIAEVETDKAVVEVPAPAAGVMVRPLKAVDETAAFDEPLCEIEVDAAIAASLGEVVGASAPAANEVAAPAVQSAPAQAVAAVAAAPVPSANGRVFATPVARRAARDAGVDLASVHGSGPNGRIVLRDVAGAAPAGGGGIHAEHLNASAASQKTTAILIHGLYGDADTWAGVSKALADAGLPVLALDLPVHGRTTANARTLDEVVGAVAAFVRERVPGRKLLVGHSLGGAVAVKLAQALGERDIAGVALIAPAGLGTEIDAGFIDGMLHAGTPALLRREIDKLTVRAQPFSDARVADMHAQLRRRGEALQSFVPNFAVRGVQQVDVRAALEALTVPVSVFWGRQDRVIPWQHALSLPPSVALHLFPEAGHMPQWESGKVVAKALLGMAGAGR